MQEFDIENIVFNIMALDADLKERVELCDSYDEMVSLAANSGLLFQGKRAIDNNGLDVPSIWGDSALDIDCDPCIQYRVGEKVCEISGLESVLEEMLQSEEATRVEELLEKGNVDGSDLPVVNIDRLNEDAAEAQRLIG